MKLIFVAGPYRASSEWEVLLNIREAERVALELWQLGASVICPHKNTAFFGGAAPDSVWLLGALEALRRCDALVCTANWESSVGACGEVDLAKSLGIPVFTSVGDARLWLESQK